MRLATRYAALIASLCIALLVLAGALQAGLGYRQARSAIGALQYVRAEAAAGEIAQYLARIEAALADTAKLPWERHGYGTGELTQEFQRLLVLAPALVDVRYRPGGQMAGVFVSRVERTTPSDLDATTCPAVEGPSYGDTFDDAGSPLVKMRLRTPRPGSCLVATINLRFLADVVSALRVGERGQVYVVDAADRLIAHPQATHGLRRLDLSAYAPVAAARAAGEAAAVPVNGMDAVDVDGQPVIVTAAWVPGPRWLVLAQQPRAEALAPLASTLWQTLGLVTLGGALAAAASVWFSRRMAEPIVTLRRATARIAAGDLASRVEARGGAELDALAADFNTMARQLAASYAGLETKVTERTAELSAARDQLARQAGELETLNQRLVRQLDALALAKDQADRANAAKTRFLAAASHDLRQPMHSVSLLTSVLRDRLTDPAHTTLADKVGRSVATMEHLFAGLLDISTLDAGAVRPRPEVHRIDDLLARVLPAYEPLAAAKGLRLRVRGCRSRPAVRTDAVIVERALGNLVSNAIRYTDRGGVLVGCRRRDGLWWVQVVDTGRGIPAAHLDDVFEEFFRLDPGHAEPGGLGLGLAIVRRSLDILGHPMRVRSRPGRGSVFEFGLPAAAPTTPAADAVDPAPPGADEAARLAGAFVLLIDDDAANRDALRALCEQWSCLVAQAAGGDDAFEELERHLRPPDLVITDYRVGSDWDGVALLQRLRAQVGASVPAIVLTADTSADVAEAVQAAGALLLSKPASADRLRRAAIALLG